MIIMQRSRNTADVRQDTQSMRAIAARKTIAVVMMTIALGGCASWQTVDKQQGALGGAASGALAGALVGGPIGAVIGGVGGAFVGYETTGYERTPATASAAPAATPAAVPAPPPPQGVVTTPLRTETSPAQ